MKTTNPTVLDYAILGLLREEGLSGYRIRKLFEETAMGNFSSSPGTIYPALKRLVALQLTKKITDESSGKNIYRITSLGTASLKAWLTKPIELVEVEKKKEELLLRFAFMDILEEQHLVIHFLESFRNLLIIHIEELNRYYLEEARQLMIHGRLAFEHGMESARVTLTWCKRALIEISNNPQP